jgi:transcriptional regulator with XRE-family HTH domain
MQAPSNTPSVATACSSLGSRAKNGRPHEETFVWAEHGQLEPGLTQAEPNAYGKRTFLRVTLWSVDRDAEREVGSRIAEARRHAGLTQRDLADLLGVSVRTVQNYEAGVAVPYKHLRTIESLGHKRPGWILDGGDDGELLTMISSLQDAMRRHHELMQRHVEEMRRHTARLRDQRHTIEGRRTRTTD